MTDITIEDVAEQLDATRTKLILAEQVNQDLRRRYNAVQNSLEEGLLGIDEEVAEEIVAFLNANSPWEFKLEREYEVRVTMVIRVEARSADAAEQAVLDSRYEASDRDLEIENVEVDGVELA